MRKIAIITILLITIFSCNKPDKTAAFIAAQYWVEKRIPIEFGETEFPAADFRADDIKNGGYIIESYFTASGEKVEYRAKIRYKGTGGTGDHDSWTLESLEFLK